MSYTVKTLKFKDEFKICPTCKYRDGFHTMIKRTPDAIRQLFICPSCHDVFDIGLSFDTDLLKASD